MTDYRVRVGITISPESMADDLDVFSDKLIDELIAINPEADLGGSAATGEFDVWVTVHADAPLDALRLGMIDITTAAHAAGGATSGLQVPTEWPEWIHEVSLAADPVLA